MNSVDIEFWGVINRSNSSFPNAINSQYAVAIPQQQQNTFRTFRFGYLEPFFFSLSLFLSLLAVPSEGNKCRVLPIIFVSFAYEIYYISLTVYSREFHFIPIYFKSVILFFILPISNILPRRGCTEANENFIYTQLVDGKTWRGEIEIKADKNENRRKIKSK